MNITLRLALLATAVAAGASLTACNKQDQQSVGQKVDGSIAEIKSATKEIRAEASAAATDAKAAGAKAAEAMSAAAKDISITAKVKAALAADAGVKLMRVDVDTSDGRVSLSGSAPDAASRERARAVANGVEGVLTVDNRLLVAP